MFKLVAFFAAYRFLRRVVMIAIAATLAVFLFSGTRDRAGQGSHSVRQLQHAVSPLEQLVQHTLQRAISP